MVTYITYIIIYAAYVVPCVLQNILHASILYNSANLGAFEVSGLTFSQYLSTMFLSSVNV